MSLNNLIINGSFENNSFPPWVSLNATITRDFSHSGYFAARLVGGIPNSFVYQIVPINAGERYEFLVSLAKVGGLPSPQVSLSIPFYDADFNFVGYELIAVIDSDRIGSVEDNDWLEIYVTTGPAPIGATQALVLVNKLPAAGTADIIVDDVSLLAVEGADGVTGPTGAAGPTGPTGGSLAQEGFSAFLPTLSTAVSTQLTGWTVTAPYFDSANFDEVTGNYTVPATGIYSIEATINYSTTAAITISLGAGINPDFVVRRTAPVTTDLISGLFPILNVNVALVLTLRAILGSGTVTLAGEVQLDSGDVIGLFYEADGLTIPLDLGGDSSEGIVWSVYRLT